MSSKEIDMRYSDLLSILEALIPYPYWCEYCDLQDKTDKDLCDACSKGQAEFYLIQLKRLLNERQTLEEKGVQDGPQKNEKK